VQKEPRNPGRFAPGDRLAPWIIQIAGIAVVFASFAAAVIGNIEPTQTGILVGAGVSLTLLGRSINISGGE
jgi:hypothetical protein